MTFPQMRARVDLKLALQLWAILISFVILVLNSESSQIVLYILEGAITPRGFFWERITAIFV